MKKKTILILTLVFTLILAHTSAAATGQTISPLWDNTQSIVLSLDLESTNSYAWAEIIGKPGTTRIEATITVYRLMNNDWIYINKTTESVNGDYLVPSVRFTALGGSNYKAIYVVHVTNSAGITESFQRAKYATS